MKTNNLPKNWTYCYVEDVACFIRGVSYKKDDASSTVQKGFIPLIRANNIQENIVYRDLIYIPKTYIAKEQFLQNRDIVLAMSSGSKHLVGKSAIVKNKINISFGTFCGVIRSKKDIIAEYMSYYLQTQKYRNYINSISQGININNLKVDHITKLRIPLPPLMEQKRIVKKIEELFTNIDIAANNLQQAKQSLIKFRESVLFRFLNLKTNSAYLKDITVKITDGTHKTPEYLNEGVPFLSVKDIYNRKLHFDSCKHISFDEHNILFKRCNPEWGDVLITKSGTIGRTAIVDVYTPFSLFVSVALIKPNKKYINSKYLMYSLDKYIASIDISQVIKGGVVKNLHIEDIKKIVISLPSLSEQKHIVAQIEKEFKKADILQQKIESALESTKQLKQSILKKAFEGKLVPQNPNDEPASVLLEKIKQEKYKNNRTKRKIK